MPIVNIRKPKPEDYRVDDVFHLFRIMCPNCGFIMDYAFDEEEIGRPVEIISNYEPYEMLDERCPRCQLSLIETGAIPIIIVSHTNIHELIGQGEGSSLEFKQQFPDPEDRIGKVIASFASAKGGRVLLGVDNDGNIKGLPVEYAASPKGREYLQTKLRDQVISQIEPRVRVNIELVDDDRSGKIVAIITVPKGPMPPYYFKRIPYVRDLTQSRPATPEEVAEMIQTWYPRSPLKE